MPDFDVLFVGAGHNALVCAGYLAQAGYRVGMLERRPVVGGAVVTEETLPGFRFDLGGSAHILIHHTPIVRELSLARYGLSYIDIDPLFFAPFPDGSRLFVWKDVERTCESIAAISPQDAETYRRFIEDWKPMAQAMADSFYQALTPLNVARTLGIESGVHKDLHRRLKAILGSYGHLLRKTFVSPQVQALVGWMAAQSGPPPTESLSGPFALWHPMYHCSGIKRPRGGSGMLTQALARMIAAHGGLIVTDAPVARILVEGGKAVDAETEGEERFTARRAVVSGAHIHTTLRLLAGRVSPARVALAQKQRGKSASQRGGPSFPAPIFTRRCASWLVGSRLHAWRWRRNRGGRALHSAAGRRFRRPYSHDAAPLGWSGLACTRGVGAETEGEERFTARRAVVSGAHIHTTLRLLAGRVSPARVALAQKQRGKSASQRGGPSFPAPIFTRRCASWLVGSRLHAWRWRRGREQGMGLG